MKRRLVAAAWSLALFSLSVLGCRTAPTPQPVAPQAVAAAAKAEALPGPKVTVATLENGLPVVLVERHAAPLVTVQVWVRAGSDTEGELTGSGMSHFVEHMLFKGTARRKTGEMDREISAAGGMVNAYTADDRTVYHITLPSKNFDLALDCLADAIQHSAFDPTECERERKVILKEINLGEDDPGRIFWQHIAGAIWRVNPRRVPTIGYRDAFLKLTRDDLAAYHRRMYVPDNMFFLAAGDIDSAAALEKVRAAFKDSPRRAFGPPRVPREPEQAEAREVRVRDGHFQDARVCLSWPTVSIASPDMYPLDMAAMLLGGGRTSRLHRRLVEEEELAFSAGAGNDTPATTGNFAIYLTLKEENVGRALAAVDEEIAKLESGAIDRGEMARVIARHRASEVFEREEVDGLAGGVGGDFLLTGDPQFSEKYLARLAQVEPAEVAAALKKYLLPFRRTLVAVLPEKKPAPAAGVEPPKPQTPAPQSAKVPKIERVELPGGAKLLLLERHEDPIVAASAAFLGGLRFEPEGQNGVSDFMANMLERGTQRHSAEELAELLEERGAKLDCYGGRNSFGAWAKFLSSDLDANLGLLAEVLTVPTFPPDEIEKLREKTIAGIRRRRESIWDQNNQLLDSLLYRGHPYSRQPIGTEESVKALTRDELVAFHDRFCRPDNMVLCLAGDFDPAEARKLVLKRFGSFLKPRPDKFAPPPVPAMPKLSGVKREDQERPGARQSIMTIGFRGVGMGDPDRPALDALAAVLGGMGSRLYEDLREKQSLAYSVGCYQDLGLDPGAFVFHIATEADKLDAALAGIRSEIGKVREAPVEEKELADAKNEILGSHARHQQEVEAIAQGLALNELYGLGAESFFTYTASVEKLTVPELQAAARKYFDLDNCVISVTRPPIKGIGKAAPPTAESSTE